MAAEVVEEVNTLDPEFFGQNPLLLFQLKQVRYPFFFMYALLMPQSYSSLEIIHLASCRVQVEFLKLVDSGDYSGALKVACTHLGPLAANDKDLLKPLKETLLALLRPNEIDFKRDLPVHALASSLQVYAIFIVRRIFFRC